MAPPPVEAAATVRAVLAQGGSTEVAVPIRIQLDGGATQVEVVLRLTLDLRRS